MRTPHFGLSWEEKNNCTGIFKFCYIDLKDKLIQFPQINFDLDLFFEYVHLMNIKIGKYSYFNQSIIDMLRTSFDYYHLSVLFNTSTSIYLTLDLSPIDVLSCINKMNNMKNYF